MKTQLAWKNLVYNRVRTAVALAGVGFAVILIFMQMGFKGAVRKTATQIYDALDFDLMLRSPAYLHLTEPRAFPRERVYAAASLPEVTAARLFYLGLSEWQAPQPRDATPDQWNGQSRGIITMGVDPHHPPFVPKSLSRASASLTDPRFVLIDGKSKPEFGPQNGVRFGEQDIGVETALGGAAGGSDLRQPQRFVLLRQLRQGGRQKLVLALEVEVDDSRRKPCGTGNMVKCRTGVTDPADGADCGVNQLSLAGFLDDAGLRSRLRILGHFTQSMAACKLLERNKNFAAMQT